MRSNRSRGSSGSGGSHRRAETCVANVGEPGSSVELGVDSIDVVWVLVPRWRLASLHCDEPNNGADIGDIGSVGSLPADNNGLAAVPHLELIEVDSSLLALAELERAAVGEARA